MANISDGVEKEEVNYAAIKIHYYPKCLEDTSSTVTPVTNQLDVFSSRLKEIPSWFVKEEKLLIQSNAYLVQDWSLLELTQAEYTSVKLEYIIYMTMFTKKLHNLGTVLAQSMLKWCHSFIIYQFTLYILVFKENLNDINIFVSDSKVRSWMEFESESGSESDSNFDFKPRFDIIPLDEKLHNISMALLTSIAEWSAPLIISQFWLYTLKFEENLNNL
ncbi:hypothetical protein C8J56DRAFT_898383 [Mycena floridula]|nr:hypothetical protein C8J56DRAFT_898383 [Mycena floridula]